jgi:hypothetical protein
VHCTPLRLLQAYQRKALKPLLTIEYKVIVSEHECHHFELEQGIGICIHIKYPECHAKTQGIGNSIYFTSRILVYCNYTTWLFLLPESYSLNVLVGNPQLLNYLHSSGGMDRFHRPEKKI